MTAPVFRITAERDCPVGQRVALALALRQRDSEWVTRADSGGARLNVIREGQPDLVLHDCQAMIEFIEDLHPDRPLHPEAPETRARHRNLMAAALRAQQRLKAVTLACDARDYDIAIYFLRNVLQRIETGLSQETGIGQPLSNLDIVLAPLLWSILVLDRKLHTHIGVGLPHLMARGRALLRHPEISALLTDEAARRLVSTLERSGSLVAATSGPTDWRRALGPEGHEVRLVRPRPRAAHETPVARPAGPLRPA